MKKKSSKKFEYIPNIISTTDLQRGSGKVVDMVRESTQPYFVVRNNKPEMVMLSIKEYEKFRKIRREWEMKDALQRIQASEKDIKKGRVNELKGSFYDLWKELNDDISKG